MRPQSPDVQHSSNTNRVLIGAALGVLAFGLSLLLPALLVDASSPPGSLSALQRAFEHPPDDSKIMMR